MNKKAGLLIYFF